MTKFITVRNFEKFQHYKDRNPPWIKLYNDLLDDYNFACLQDASKLHLILLWLLASRSDNRIPADEKWIASRINATSKVNLKELVSSGFISINEEASDMLAESKQNACLETEGETEIEIEKEGARARKKRISLEELSTEHVRDWLEKKRSKGRYKNHDPDFVLEKLKDYCLASNVKYQDYIAAYRNAFDWEKCQPKSNGENNANNFNANGRNASKAGGGFQGQAGAGSGQSKADQLAAISAKVLEGFGVTSPDRNALEQRPGGVIENNRNTPAMLPNP